MLVVHTQNKTRFMNVEWNVHRLAKAHVLLLHMLSGFTSENINEVKY